MRFMMFMLPNISDADWMPTAEAVATMNQYNEELAKAGVLLALDGLHPGTDGARVSFPGGKAKATDGPFAEAKEVVGGYWLIDVKSKDEAVEWAKRAPLCRRPGHRGPSGHGDRGLPARGAEGRGEVSVPMGREAPGQNAPGQGAPGAESARRAIEAVWRIESARVIAGLARYVGDVGVGEDLAHDALAAALESVAHVGRPRQPRGVAHDRGQATRRRPAAAQDGARAQAGRARSARPRGGRRSSGLGTSSSTSPTTTSVTTCCGSSSSRVTPSCPPTPRGAHAPAPRRPHDRRDRPRLPRPGGHRGPAHRAGQAHAVGGQGPVRGARGAPTVDARLASVLEVLYLIFNEGYSATAGDDWMRPPLCEDALRLGRVLAELLPDEPEVHGLVALMEIQASRCGPGSVRRGAGPAARPGPGPWDHVLIRRGLGGARAGRATGPGVWGRTRSRPPSPRAMPAPARASETDWVRIAALYDALAQLAPSPVVELNRAVAYSMAFGPEVALELVDALQLEPALGGLPPPAQCARRPPRETGPVRRGPVRVRAGRGADAQHPGAHAPPSAPRRWCRVRMAPLDPISSCRGGSPARRPPARRVAGRRR